MAGHGVLDRTTVTGAWISTLAELKIAQEGDGRTVCGEQFLNRTEIGCANKNEKMIKFRIFSNLCKVVREGIGTVCYFTSRHFLYLRGVHIPLNFFRRDIETSAP
jgi:hypothetical protein